MTDEQARQRYCERNYHTFLIGLLRINKEEISCFNTTIAPLEGLTKRIDSIIKKEMPQVLAECDPAFTGLNRLRPFLGEAYYKRGVLLDEKRRC